MMISTRGRYALCVMVDLAENSNGNYIPMKEIAKRHGISPKYMERILPVLVQNGLLEGLQGKSGGYRLTRKPEEYPLGEILRLTEGDLVPVSCMECDADDCESINECRTYPMWEELSGIINRYLDGKTLACLMQKEGGEEDK